MAMNTASDALRNVFSSPGLGALLPQQGSNLTDILQQLGVNVPAPLQGMGEDQISGILGVKSKLESAPTFQNFFDDPGKVSSFVTGMWKEFNKMVEDQGGPPIGIVQFVQAAGFRPEVQQMFASMFGGGAAMGGAEAALGGALG